MGKHTNEPWDETTHPFIDAGLYDGMSPSEDCHELSLVDFERAAKCVNACANMEDPQAEIERLKAEHARMLNVIRVMQEATANDPTWINTNRVLSDILKDCTHA